MVLIAIASLNEFKSSSKRSPSNCKSLTLTLSDGYLMQLLDNVFYSLVLLTGKTSLFCVSERAPLECEHFSLFCIFSYPYTFTAEINNKLFCKQRQRQFVSFSTQLTFVCVVKITHGAKSELKIIFSAKANFNSLVKPLFNTQTRSPCVCIDSPLWLKLIYSKC